MPKRAGGFLPNPRFGETTKDAPTDASSQSLFGASSTSGQNSARQSTKRRMFKVSRRSDATIPTSDNSEEDKPKGLFAGVNLSTQPDTTSSLFGFAPSSGKSTKNGSGSETGLFGNVVASNSSTSQTSSLFGGAASSSMNPTSSVPAPGETLFGTDSAKHPSITASESKTATTKMFAQTPKAMSTNLGVNTTSQSGSQSTNATALVVRGEQPPLTAQQFFTEFMALNKSFAAWAAKQQDENPLADWSPGVRDYLRHAENLKDRFRGGNAVVSPDVRNGKSSETSIANQTVSSGIDGTSNSTALSGKRGIASKGLFGNQSESVSSATLATNPSDSTLSGTSTSGKHSSSSLFSVSKPASRNSSSVFGVAGVDGVQNLTNFAKNTDSTKSDNQMNSYDKHEITSSSSKSSSGSSSSNVFGVDNSKGSIGAFTASVALSTKDATTVPSSSSSLFGGAIENQATISGGLFGSSGTTVNSDTSLFGASKSPATSTSLFGQAQAGTTSLFDVSTSNLGSSKESSSEESKPQADAPKTSSLFANTSATAESKTPTTTNSSATSLFGGGLFGAEATPSTDTSASLFGNLSSSNASGSADSGSLFGNLASNTETKPASSGMFSGLLGNSNNTDSTPAASASGLFGSSSTGSSTAGSGGLFGSSSTGSSTAATGGLFGSSSVGSSTAATGGLFGSSSVGSSTTATGGLFGSSSVGSSTAATGGLFGSLSSTPAASNSSGLFGDMANTSSGTTATHNTTDANEPSDEANQDQGQKSTTIVQEDEDLLFEHRARVFRFNTPQPAHGDDEKDKETREEAGWGDLGTGTLRVIKHKTKAKGRVCFGVLMGVTERFFVNDWLMPNVQPPKEQKGNRLQVILYGFRPMKAGAEGAEQVTEPIQYLIKVKTAEQLQQLKKAMEDATPPKEQD